MVLAKRASGMMTGVAGAMLAMSLAATAAEAAVVTFIPGTYSLAESSLGTPIDTLTVGVSNGIADFTLTGLDNATFSIPNNATPAGYYGIGDNPYFIVAPPVTASFSGSQFPYLTFYSTLFSGGVSAGSIPGDLGSNVFDVFESSYGMAQVFSVTPTPLPSSWIMMLGGLALYAFVRRLMSSTTAADRDLPTLAPEQ